MRIILLALALALALAGCAVEARPDLGDGDPASLVIRDDDRDREVLAIGPAAWHPLDGDEALFHRYRGFLELDAAGSAWANVPVAVGRRVERIAARVWRSSGTVDLQLVAIDESGTATTIVPMPGGVTSTSTGGLQTLWATYGVVLAPMSWFSVSVGTSSGGLQLMGARIEVEVAP